MFDQEGDAMSVYSQSSRMPSLVMPPGMSMQDYYKALEIQAAELNAAHAQQVGASRRGRRNSDSSVMSDTERLYGWSGSRGGISNNEQGPKYRINSQGHLVLAEEIQKKKETATSPLQAKSSPAAVLGANNNGATPTKPALRTARSDGTKPMYRPAFAPSAVLPPTSDEEIDEDDRVIQHDLPTTRPLKSRPSLKQKLGSLVARVGSVRRGGLASPPVNAGATSPNGKNEDASPAKDYLSVKRATTSAAAYGRRTRPDLTRKGSSLASGVTPEEGEGVTNDPDVETKVAAVDGTSTQPIVTLTGTDDNDKTPTPSPALKHDDDKAYLSADGGAYMGGMVSLARKLSRRATTGNRNRSRSVPRNLREEREKQADQLQDKESAEKMLKDLAKIPLYKPPRSAHVKNAKPLSSFPPRAPLKVTSEQGSLANAPRYKRPLNDIRNDVGRSNTTGGSNNRSMHNHGRGRSGSTPSTFSSFSSQSGLPLLNGMNGKTKPSTIKEGSQDEDESIPPVPPLPELTKDAPITGQPPPGDGATTNWTVFKKESSTSLNKN